MADKPQSGPQEDHRPGKSQQQQGNLGQKQAHAERQAESDLSRMGEKSQPSHPDKPKQQG